MLIAGVDKGALIGNQPLLSWYRELFTEYLARPDTRLLVIGYSFSDDHINNALVEATKGGHLKLFIVDPLGIDVLDKNRTAAIYTPGSLFVSLSPHVTGASRRSLSETFGRDHAENQKLMKFLR